MKDFKFHLCPNRSKRLENRLKKKFPLLSNRYQQIKKAINIEIEKKYFSVFPDYKGNSSDHGEQAICILDTIIPSELLSTLKGIEIFLLIIGCHIHDIGMFIEKKPYDRNIYLMHYVLGQKVINESEWLLLSLEERQVLGNMARWHNYLLWIKSYAPVLSNISIDGVEVRVMLLIQLLQMTDFYHKIVDVKWKNFPEFSNVEEIT